MVENYDVLLLIQSYTSNFPYVTLVSFQETGKKLTKQKNDNITKLKEYMKPLIGDYIHLL